MSAAALTVSQAQRTHIWCQDGSLIFPGGFLYEPWNSVRAWRLPHGQRALVLGLFGTGQVFTVPVVPVVVDDFGDLQQVRP